MNKMQFILIFVVFGLAFSQRLRVDYGSLRDNLQTGSYYAQELTTGLQSGDILQSTQNVFGLISQIHPVAGAVGSAVYFCLSIFGAFQQTENPLLVAVREGVTVICRKLDRISNALRDLEHEIKLEIRGLSLEHQVDDIEGLLLLQQKLVVTGDNQSIYEFLNSCSLSRIYEKPFWFTKALTANNPNDLKHVILKERDATELNGYYQRIISVFFQAVILASSCTAVRFKEASNETLQRYLDSKGEDSENLLKQIYESLKRDVDLITNDFIDHALRDLVQTAQNYDGQDRGLATKHLKSVLDRKYNFRNWLVIVYGDSNTYGSYKHTIAPNTDNELVRIETYQGVGYFRNYLRFHGTNYVIATPTTRSEDSNWKKTAYGCASGFAQSEGGCENLEKLTHCLLQNSESYLVAGCVYEHHFVGDDEVNMVTVENGLKLVFVVK